MPARRAELEAVRRGRRRRAARRSGSRRSGPRVCVSRCHIRIGSVAGTVTGLFWLPPAHTRASANAGRKRATGSLSSNAPSSHSIIAATDVIGLVIE